MVAAGPAGAGAVWTGLAACCADKGDQSRTVMLNSIFFIFEPFSVGPALLLPDLTRLDQNTAEDGAMLNI